MNAKKKDKAKAVTQSESVNGSQPVLNSSVSDFWWNLAYFIILSTAITFILVNNSMSRIMSGSGSYILSVLILLDIFPAIYLLKVAIRYQQGKRHQRRVSSPSSGTR